MIELVIIMHCIIGGNDQENCVQRIKQNLIEESLALASLYLSV